MFVSDVGPRPSRLSDHLMQPSSRLGSVYTLGQSLFACLLFCLGGGGRFSAVIIIVVLILSYLGGMMCVRGQAISDLYSSTVVQVFQGNLGPVRVIVYSCFALGVLLGGGMICVRGPTFSDSYSSAVSQLFGGYWGSAQKGIMLSFAWGGYLVEVSCLSQARRCCTAAL